MSISFEEELRKARAESPWVKGDPKLTWIAGLVEGEGCFVLESPKNTKYKQPKITVSSTDEDVIRKLHSLVGFGSVHSRTKQQEHWKQVWNWCGGGKKAISLLKKLLSYMGSRRSTKMKELITTYEREHNVNVD